MGAGVAVGVELRRLWIRERRAGAGRNCCYHLGGVRGIRTRAGTGWAAGDGETWRLTGERAEQLYRDLSWNSVVLSCTVTSRAAQASTAGNGRNSNSQSSRTPRDFVSLCVSACVCCDAATVAVTVAVLLSTSRCSPTRAAHATGSVVPGQSRAVQVQQGN